MKPVCSLGDMIKRYILMRGRNIKEVAASIGIPEKTLYDAIQNNRISADRLFKLSALLDMDLNYLVFALGYDGPTSAFDRLQVVRMNSGMRKEESKRINSSVNYSLFSEPESIEMVAIQLVSGFPLYYLLDVLIPEDCMIQTMKEGETEKYFVSSPRMGSHSRGKTICRGRLPERTISGMEALRFALICRKDNLNEYDFL